MKSDGGNIQILQTTKDVKMSFRSSCPAVSQFGYSQNSNQREQLIPAQEEAISPAARESQRTDVCNGNLLNGGSPPESLHHCPWLNSGQKLPGGHGRNKRCGDFGQQPKEILPTKLATSAQNDFLSKDVFLFWATKLGDSSKVTRREAASKNPLEQRRLMGNSHGRLAKEGLEVLARQCWPPSTSPGTSQRKTRRELFPDSGVFGQLDARVLHVTEQLKPKQTPLSVQNIVPLITEGARSQLEKARAIWVWLCHNIKYDVDGFLGLSEKIHTPKEVLQTGRGVCSGYAHLCREMCKEAGLACVEISGYGRGTGYSHGQRCLQKKSNHVWNAVKLGAQWFLLDACWGAGLVDVEKRLFLPRHDDFFFLTNPEDFIESHWPDDPKWQIIQPPIPLEVLEERAFKTPEFFKLHLTLLSADTSLLKIDQGEASVSLASASPTEFTYQLFRLCHDDSKEDIGQSHGMLTMTENRMVLRVFPPTKGLFDLQIFARPSNSWEPYTWVCSHQIECLEPNSQEGLPENPFPYWGLHPKAREYGIRACNWEDDQTISTRGTLTLVLQTQRPLLATYELAHEDLDASLSKKCLVSQAEEEKLSCHVLCPFVGYYRLSVFVKGLGEDEFKNTANFLIGCSGTINHNELFPLGLSTHCGTGINTRWRGLSSPSHTAPIINTLKGRCNITFRTPPGFEVLATLGKDKITNQAYPIERYILVTHLEKKVSVSVLLPESGLYRVGLYGRNIEGKEFTHVCDYVVRCFTNPQWLPFPRVYSLWRKGCVLFQPRTGVLQEKSWVRFRIKMPMAYSAHVVGQTRIELKLGKNKVWEGEVHTGLAGTKLKVAVKLSRESPSMDVILAFDVGGSSSAPSDTSG